MEKLATNIAWICLSILLVVGALLAILLLIMVVFHSGLL